MHTKRSQLWATLILLTALALLAAVGFPPHAGAGRSTDAKSVSSKAVTIVIRDFKFEPATVTVHVGDTVEWKNADFVPHTATDDSHQPVFDSDKIEIGGTWHYVAQKKGTYDYICTLHPNMTGRLVVQ